VLPGADVAGASLVADKILQKLYEPFTIEERLIHARISIGIVLYPEHGGDVSTLLRCADVAMHAAKQIGNCYEVYAPALNKHDAAGLELAGQLRQAIDRNQLTLHYQPKVRLSDNSLAGVEALVRWQHPERGLVSPVHFVPFAEHTGMIRPLTNWVLGQALRQCGEWRRSGLALQIAVNLSARNLHDPALLRTVSELLREHALDPSYLRLEIVESTVMSDPTRALQVLQRFSDMGVGIAVDDFGTGYSSLTYLKKLPVHEVKIDKSFVTDMSHDAEAGVIVSSVIDLGHNLGLQVTAEGVEDRQSLALLKAQGCDLAQGYFLSRPIPPEQLSGWIQDTLRSTETWRSQPSPAFAAT
ncbi:MAG TPA: GGDEF domain-containing phosphodiesterase, partial [Chloroflexota bacterium]